MNKVKFKIKSYDPETSTIIVRYASDDTASSNPDDYEEVAMQPNLQFTDVTDFEQIKKFVAEAGIGICESQKVMEKAVAEQPMRSNWESVVGQTFEYNVDDVLQQEVTVTNANEVEV